MDISEFDQTETNRKRSGIYLLPNLFTIAGLFGGFYGIIAAMKGDFESAVIALFIAMIMDGLDGRVARLTNTVSSFGAELDSLSDMVCFGLAPALVVYSWGLQYLGKLGWICAFVYVSATALRLARFNLQTKKATRFFSGLPCPAAAGAIAGAVWLGTDFAVPGKVMSEVVAFMTVVLALLQVTPSIKYYSFKELDLKENVPFMAVLSVVILYAIIAWDPPKILCTTFILYALSGVVLYLRKKLQERKNIKLELNKATQE